MIELDSDQLRRIAGTLDAFGQNEVNYSVAVHGHRGTIEITVVGGAYPAAEEVLLVARADAADGPRYVLQIGD
jgi:hypothetical protein